VSEAGLGLLSLEPASFLALRLVVTKGVFHNCELDFGLLLHEAEFIVFILVLSVDLVFDFRLHGGFLSSLGEHLSI
jgi:hypothetical protein